MSDDAININEKYFRQIENILLKIESAYQNKFVTQGSLINKQFYAERDALFSQLKPLLKIIVENFIKLNKYHDVKQPVKLAVKPTAHPWDYTGKATRADGATDINSAEKATAFMNMGGWVALDISFTDTSNDIYHACTTGRERECGQVALKNTVSLLMAIREISRINQALQRFVLPRVYRLMVRRRLFAAWLLRWQIH